MTVDINYLAVLALGVAAMVIGSLWYSPILFGKPWMKLTGLTDEKMADPPSLKLRTGEGEEKKGVAGAYIGMFIAALLTAYVMAHFVSLLGIVDFMGAFQLAVWSWLGFTAATTAGDYLFLKKPFTLYLINVGYYLPISIVMATILTFWK
ncbi:MAG: hypothetical protein A3F24_00160 [Candidatus Colwellbacteria bacterium RIFCSPHIGHO2_12_FULL_44_17]|uniref:DUF1761 domain-containing protein n=2 Tax=Candidatus Colwelliibacteriota TaxID=1817904 RepID=A0A1G1Z3T5_9BACT|nr:MAG: hypothetical protein A3I31_02230 [Candidatus Colwellbacteria bacterium RIFCSPLOWO2_02_FULL_44_20b]OGY59884.1 MAG: hypothetical protein A3F24_00160 [Candidatus Colwellbacteria bacterium RIFCSPHIGHO2_12_FULL_44_17]